MTTRDSTEYELPGPIDHDAVVSASSAIKAVIAGSKNIDVLEVVRRALPADAIIVCSVADERSGLARILLNASDTYAPRPSLIAGGFHKFTDSVGDFALQAPEPITESFSSGLDMHARFPGVCPLDLDDREAAVTIVPLIQGSKPVGLASFWSSSITQYAPEHIDTARSIADSLIDSVITAEEKAAVQTSSSNSALSVEEHQAFLTSLLIPLSDAGDLGDKFEYLSEHILERIPFSEIGLTQVDEDDGLFFPKFRKRTEKPGVGTEETCTGYQIQRSVLEPLVSRKHSIVEELGSKKVDATRLPDPTLADDYPNGCNLALIPVIWEHKFESCLWLVRPADYDFEEHEITLITQVGVLMSGAIARDRLRRQEIQVELERALISNIGLVTGQAQDIGTTWEEISRKIQQLIPHQRLNVVLVDRPSESATTIYDAWTIARDPNRWLQGDTFAIDGTATQLITNTGEGWLYTEGDEDQLQACFPTAFSESTVAKFRSFIGQPLLSGGEVFGVVFFSALAPNSYTQRHAYLAERIASQLAGPIAGEYRRLEQQAITAEYLALNTMGRLLSQTEDISEVFDKFRELTEHLLSVDQLKLNTIDTDNGTVTTEMASTTPNVNAGNDNFKTVSLDGSFAGYVQKTGETLLIPSSPPDEILSEFQNAIPGDSMWERISVLVVPVFWSNDVIAVLEFISESEPGYSVSDKEIAERIAAQVAGQIAGRQISRQREQIATSQLQLEQTERERQIHEQVSRTKSEFVGSMSHELKTPLTSIVAFADVLTRNSRGDLSERSISQLQVIQRNARYLESMIDELLDLSRIETGKFEIVKSDVVLSEQVNLVIENFAPIFEPRNQVITVQIVNDELQCRSTKIESVRS